MVQVQRHNQHSALGALEQYMRMVKWTPQLTNKEEAELFLRIASDSDEPQARDRLIEGYQPLLIGLAKRFVHTCQQMELLDLIQEGNIGLLQAIEKYDRNKEASSFRTFAFAWVRGAMLAAFWQYEGCIRIPMRQVKAIKHMNVVNAALLAEHGREPTMAETAQQMNLKECVVLELTILQEQQVVSLHMQVDEDTLLEDIIVDPDAARFADDGVASVDEVFEQLTEREQVVLKLRYGFQDGKAYTQREVASLLGVTLSTVQGVDRHARIRLRRALAA